MSAGGVAPTVLIGLGNTLMRDEGVGVYVCREVAKRAQADAQRYGHVRFAEMAVGGLAVMHAFGDADRAVLVDCARMGLAPGEARSFTPEQVESVKKLAGFSLHEVDILRVIELARDVEQCPAEIVIVGIEPELVEHGETMTDALNARFDEYVDIVEREILRA